jgi:pimeloyl-ACP methyl ester carboxylesterase
MAAADRGQLVRAVVSRGGRPDLAGPALDRVIAPTLLIVGGRDDAVLDLNRAAYDRLQGVRELEIVQDATHLFEEPGALDKVGHLAAAWFLEYLPK